MDKFGVDDFLAKGTGFWLFDVNKLTNGYTVMVGASIDPATYVPDLEGVLRHIAFAIGGEDAVPLYPVSAEEAGLVDPNEPPLPLELTKESKAIEGVEE